MSSPFRSITIINEAGDPIAGISRLSHEVWNDTAKAAFSSALRSFSLEVSGSRSVQSVDFADYRLVYLESSNYIIVVEVDKEINQEIVYWILEKIAQEIQQKYSTLTERFVDPELFSSLNEFLRQFIQLTAFKTLMQSYGYEVAIHPRGVILIEYGKDTPEIIHSHGVDRAIISEIAYRIPKSFIQSIKNEIETQTESIVPFPHNQQIGFVFFSSIPVADDSIPAALTILFPFKEQVTLYRQAPVLSKRAKEVFSRIKNEVSETGLYQLSTYLLDQINELTDIAKFEISGKERIIEREITFEKPEIIEPDVRFLIKAAKKNISAVVDAVIIGRPIAVIGDPSLIKLAFATLEVYCPHRSPSKVLSTTEFIKADFVGINPKLRKEFQKKGYIILDLPNKKVFFEKNPSSFAKNLLDSTKDLKGDVRRRLIQTRINWLISRATNLAEICRGEVKRKEIEKIKKDVKDKDTFELIIKIAETYNPATKEKIRRASFLGVIDYKQRTVLTITMETQEQVVGFLKKAQAKIYRKFSTYDWNTHKMPDGFAISWMTSFHRGFTCDFKTILEVTKGEEGEWHSAIVTSFTAAQVAGGARPSEIQGVIVPEITRIIHKALEEVN